MKKIFQISTALSLILSLILSSIACKTLPSEDSSNPVTRGEWISMLNMAYGFGDVIITEPYFDDVTADDPLFARIQACVAWQILANDEHNFNANEPATKEFVATTAVKATGIEYEGSILQFAAKNDILLDPKNPAQVMHQGDCQQAIAASLELYQARGITPEENILIKNTVVDYASEPVESIVSNGSQTTFNSDLGADLQAGDIFIVPASSENPGGEAKKVVSVETVNGQTVVATSEPEFSEVYDTLDFSAIIVPDEGDWSTGDGVTLNNYNVEPLLLTGDNDGHYSLLSNTMPVSKEKGASFSFKISMSDNQVTLNPEYGDLSNKWTLGNSAPPFFQIDGRKVQKFSGGRKVEGEIKVSNFYIETEFSSNPYHYRQVVHYEIEYNISLIGTLSAEQRKMALGKITIPVCAGVWVYLTLNLELEANGEFEVSRLISNTTTTEYTEGIGMKKVTDQDDQTNPSLKGDISVYVGPELSLCAVGFVLAELYLKVGVTCEGAFIDYGGGKYCLDFSAYLPIIKLEFCTNRKSVLGKLGVSFTFDLVSKENAREYNCHFESETGWVDACTHEPGTGEEISPSVSAPEVISAYSLYDVQTNEDNWEYGVSIDMPRIASDKPGAMAINVRLDQALQDVKEGIDFCYESEMLGKANYIAYDYYNILAIKITYDFFKMAYENTITSVYFYDYINDVALSQDDLYVRLDIDKNILLKKLSSYLLENGMADEDFVKECYIGEIYFDSQGNLYCTYDYPEDNYYNVYRFNKAMDVFTIQ